MAGSVYLNDIWTLSLGDDPEWIEISALGTPPSARTEHAAVYDPARNRVVVMGGYDGGAYRRDVWALSLDGTPTWTLLDPTGVKPLARKSHTAIYDASRDRMIVFGGTKPPVRYDDTWALDFAGAGAWSEILPTGPRPERTVDHGAVYDPSRDRMVVFGGSGQTIQNVTTALSFSGTPAWSVLATAGTTPEVRFRAASVYDPSNDRLVLFGGASTSGTLNDLWTLDWGTATGVPLDAPFEPAAASLLKPSRPNPFASSAQFDFSLAATGRARLEVFDVSGRRRRLVLDSALPPGEHSAIWNGADDAGRPVASGAYFLRLSTPSGVAVQKVTRIHDALR